MDYFPDAGYTVTPSVPKIVVFEKYSNTIFLYQILNGTRKEFFLYELNNLGKK